MSEEKKWVDDGIYIPVLEKGAKLYHYTSAEGLNGICSKKEFWVTEYHSLNDSTEFQIGTEVFGNVLEMHIPDKAIAKEIVRRLKSEVKRLETPGKIDEEVAYFGKYVISFCLDEDSPLMWAEYSDFMGYCMKFDFYKLLDAFEGLNPFHGKVIYSYSEQLECVEETIKQCFFEMDGFEYLSNWNDFVDLSDEQIEDFVQFAAVVCIMYNMFFKKDYFKGEHEYRFVFDCIHDGGLVSDKDRVDQLFRIKNGTFIPYVKREIKILDSLESVLVGPKNNSDIAVKGLEYFFRQLKVKVDVSKSDIPLRY